jgi:4-hydroxy-tetrahydrodipicolinate synthase
VLSEAEVVALTRRVRESVDVPILVGTGTNDTAEDDRADQVGCPTSGIQGVLVVTPYYSRPSQAGLADHFAQVANSTHLDVVLYDIPVRTGRRIEPETLLTLARETWTTSLRSRMPPTPRPSPPSSAASAPEGFEIYSGEDAMTLPIVAVGGVGVISVASHWVGRQFQAFFDAIELGDLVEARRQNARMLPSFAFEGGDETPNPIPTKAMMRVLGFGGGPVPATRRGGTRPASRTGPGTLLAGLR